MAQTVPKRRGGTRLRIDLNADIGEASGDSATSNDKLLMRSITSGNIACGFHAGGPAMMRDTVRLSASAGVSVGAHPSFADTTGFGRRELNSDPAEITALVSYQIGALAAIARAEGVKLQHVKPHGALYNMSVRRTDIADAIATAVAAFDNSLIIVGLPGSELLAAALRLGLPVAAEGFADRAYEPDGSLTPRDRAGAVLTDPAVIAERAVRIVRDRQVVAREGSVLTVQVDTICVHGDTPGAAVIAAAVRLGLENAGVTVAPLTEHEDPRATRRSTKNTEIHEGRKIHEET
jgi:5-oxoprolinase (ATP-hydrolysing) subunit A